MEDRIKEMIIKEENKDSLEVRELAKGGYTFTVKLHTDFNKEGAVEEVIKKFEEIKNKLKPKLKVI